MASSVVALGNGVSNVPAWYAAISPVTTLLGGLGGYWLADRNEEARDKRAGVREAAARQATLGEQLEEQRHTFQRDTMLELQDELQRLARITARMVLQDQSTLKEKGRLYQLPEGLSDQSFEIGVSVRRLTVRVLDPTLRQAVNDFHALCSALSIPVGAENEDPERVQASLKHGLREMSDRYTTLSDVLGNRLRAELDRRYLAGDAC